MRLSPRIKATLAAVIIAAALFLMWREYEGFLSQGQKPPESTQILNKIERDGIPPFSIQDIQGQEITLAKFGGKVVILNFWASWCDPCIAEFPSLMRLVDHFKGDVVLLAVSADYERKDIDTFLKAFKVQNPNVYVAWDKDFALAKQFGTYKLPESFIIGRDGKFVRKVSGVDDWSTTEAFEYFAHLLSAGR